MHLTRQIANEFYADFLRDAESRGEAAGGMAELGRVDLFFLLTRILHRQDANRDWLYDRCVEVQKSPDGMLDLWAREHYKSTIITFALTIQDILKDPEVTVGIFSHTRPIAKGFLRQIKVEFEGNDLLKLLYPSVLYQNPRQESVRWSEDNGIVVKRRTNPKESTIEAWGLVDGQPTSKHFSRLIYDDVVTRESVTTPEMIDKTTKAWELSLNLAAEGGAERYIGTRYHFNDTYKTIIDRKAAVPRIHPATDNGELDGNPVLLTREALDSKRTKMGVYTYGCQMLQNPKADTSMGFREEWLKYWVPNTNNLNICIICDPAAEKKKSSDYTVLKVIGYGSDKNYYLIDFLRDRLNLTERTAALFRLHKKYFPSKVGYEKYGMQADIEHIKDVQERENYRFEITELGGNMPKNDRIRRLVPLFEAGRIFIPEVLMHTDYEGRTVNLIQSFVNDEYMPFPVSAHDDMLDCLSRICDEDMKMSAPAEGGQFVPNRRKRLRLVKR